MLMKKKSPKKKNPSINGENDKHFRSSCLSFALQIRDKDGNAPKFEDEVIKIAEKFYNFIENKTETEKE